MSERLTDEQVAEALEWADAWLSATYVSRGAQQFLLIARFMRQVSADLSAAKEENVDSDRVVTENYDAIAAATGCPTWEYPGQVVRGVEELAKSALASQANLAALQEAAREAEEGVEAEVRWLSSVGGGDGRSIPGVVQRLTGIASSLRAHLPEAGR